MKLEEQLLGAHLPNIDEYRIRHDHFFWKIITNLFIFCYLCYDC